MGAAQSTRDDTSNTAAVVGNASDMSKDTSTASHSTDSIFLSQQHEPYSPPEELIHPMAHYIFLVHGWLGNDLEMSYLSEAFAQSIAANDGRDKSSIHDAKRIKRSDSQLAAAEVAEKENQCPPVVVHSVKCNVNKTHDGIKNGGTRLAKELVEVIRSDLQKMNYNSGMNGDTTNRSSYESTEGHITYSIVGNSLGGLYARYAISLVPRQVSIPRIISSSSSSNNQQRIHIHPNIFCTTATPHLGVSQHTYVPIPRIAETIIGSSLGVTGADLFRLNSDKTGRENPLGAGVRRLSGAHGVLGGRVGNYLASNYVADDGTNQSSKDEAVDEEMECIIRNMCLQEKYLGPLRNFRRRIAYANAYGTDFQVPTQTAAFLNAQSEVEHTVIACRDVDEVSGSGNEDGKHQREDDSNNARLPPFIVAVLSTEQQTTHLIQQIKSSNPTTPDAEEELLKMSQSLDALGWTKVFIDVRNRIPIPGIPKPSWRLLPFSSALSTILPEPDTALENLIHSRRPVMDKLAEDMLSDIFMIHNLSTVLSKDMCDRMIYPMMMNGKSQRRPTITKV
eukprot:scaffold25398_cov65-Cyclotella_meneghiniana.AAC.1